MRISARADYAVRAAIQLAAQTDGNVVTAETLGRLQQIPKNYLNNILSQLRRADIVRTQRGPEGGYSLARPAGEITVGDVLRAVEGPLAAVQGYRPDELTYPGPAEGLVDVWLAVRTNLRAVVDNTSLADVVAGNIAGVTQTR